MKPKVILGLLLGIFGIVVLDLGFSGSAMTDLFYIPQVVKNIIPPASTQVGGSFVSNLMPGGNTTLFLGGAVFLGVGMIILILDNRNLGKPSVSAVPAK